MAGPLGKMVTVWNKNVFAWLRVTKGSPFRVADRRWCSKNPEDNVQKAPHAASKPSSNGTVYKDTISPSNWHKRILLLSRRYKKEEDIPEFVPASVMQAAASKLRVYIGTTITVITLIGFFFAALSGKQAMKLGRSSRTINLERKSELSGPMTESSPPKV